MTGSRTLERRYRRLLAMYPKRFRRWREEEMLSVLMAGAHEGQRWPRPAEAANLLLHAAPTHVRQGPPPGSFARRHARGVIVTRVLVGIWLIVLTIAICRYTLWGLLLLPFVAAHAYLAVRAAAGMRQGPGGDEPPSPSSVGG